MLKDHCTVRHQHSSAEILVPIRSRSAQVCRAWICVLLQCCSTVLGLGLQNCEDLPACGSADCRTAQISADTDTRTAMTSDSFTEVCCCGYMGTYMCLLANVQGGVHFSAASDTF